ncbi:AbrB/MazE/SpoVT family DNA-binding domain-containing protein [Cyanobium sp. AMD-g]|uniref:AbrB/MazE/SpoVT family DNA-binding domain-containing protein n=1 Tax=Cyanobium sp. AMD-g TaxID=2823699 RepID=UPI0020CE4F92|nr:AbrB/MazE/SpoVT family DNA-binding domain-containing protein [Cyanobium sp. AMD-g]MCP9931499.1 AbrB/MazE/SpoVT family DNA-binding domain-containing protein [Cyanobium sp. AMD-g]
MVRIHQGALADTSGGPGHKAQQADVDSRIYSLSATAELDALTPPQSNQPQPSRRQQDPVRHFQQSIRRWGNSLAIRIPADCLRQAGLREGDPIEIVVGADGRLSLEPVQRLDRRALAADLRQLQATMPITPSVIEACREQERW